MCMLHSFPLYLPVVVRQMMAAALWANAASTAAMEVVMRVSVGLGVRRRSSSNTTRWNMAASASQHILCIMSTV